MPVEQNTLLTANRITLSYGDQSVFKEFSLKIESGTFIGLVGPNGAGKTTLMLGLSGQFKPLHGSVVFLDQDIYLHNLTYKEKTGYVHEHPFIYPYLTVTDYLYVVARLKKISTKTIDKEIDRILMDVCLDGEKDKPGSALSMGMQKKLALAAALLGLPRLLFLDEALNGIDIESAFRIKAVLQRYVRNGGTVLLSTHAIEVVEKLCDRYVILQSGKVVGDIDAGQYRQQQGDLESYIIGLLEKTA